MKILITLVFILLSGNFHSQDKIKLTDPEKFFKDFFKVKIEKGEFETSDAYSERLLKHLQTIDALKTYYFKTLWKTLYNADNEFFYVIYAIPSVENFRYKDEDFENQKIIASEKVNKVKTYKTSNAMGSKVTVTVYNKEMLYFKSIDISKQLRLEMSDEAKFIFTTDSILIGTASSKAKNIKDDIAVAIGISLFPSFSFTGKELVNDYVEPTFTDPIEVFIKEYYIPAQLVDIVIYNKRTNQVIKRLENPYEPE